jgi:hypothetical protein
MQARSMKRRTASYCPSAGRRSVPKAKNISGSGAEREGTGQTNSPAVPSASRLVTNVVRPEHARIKAAVRCAQASTTCSQLSRTSRSLRGLRESERVSESERPDASRKPSAPATLCGTSAGSVSAASSTTQTPSG